MFYFSYDLGEFYVIREFTDSYDAEIVDVIPFCDVKKIKKWCKFANIKFPYEINDYANNLLSIIDSGYENCDDCDNIDYCLVSFHIHVINGDIKLYCKEKEK